MGKTFGATISGILAATLLTGLAGGAGADEPPPLAFPRSVVLADKTQTVEDKAEGPRTRIYNGDIAVEGAWPWQVGLLSKADDTVFNRQFCGGSLITRTWVLTAAHCLYDEGDDGAAIVTQPSEVDVLVGTNLLIPGHGEVIPVIRVVVHPAYDPHSMDSDIAIMELAYPPASAAAQAVRLPSPAVEPLVGAVGVEAVVTGWGKLANGEFPVDLREVRIEMMDTAECNRSVVANWGAEIRADFEAVQAYLEVKDAAVSERAWQMLLDGAEPPLTNNMICSGSFESRRGSCNGDSGGPLMVKLPDESFIQLGVVSWGLIGDDDIGCETEGPFAFYTRVANYADWIRTTIVDGAAVQAAVPAVPAGERNEAVAPAAR